MSAQAWACWLEQEWAFRSAQASACMAQTACSMLPLHVRPTIPLVAAHIGLSPDADVDEHWRSPSVVPAMM